MDALPLTPDARVLEIGCGPGAAAQAVADRLGSGHVLALDRSAKAVAQATAGSAAQIAATRPHARLFVDGGDPLRELTVPRP